MQRLHHLWIEKNEMVKTRGAGKKKEKLSWI
jgi:hypothetical protein